MAKQVVATMDIQHDGERYPMGQPIDPKKFSKDQLTRLYERGAVRIEEAGATQTVEPTMDDLNRENELQAKDDAPDGQKVVAPKAGTTPEMAPTNK